MNIGIDVEVTYTFTCSQCDQKTGQTWNASHFNALPVLMRPPIEWNILNGLPICPRHSVIIKDNEEL